MADCEQCAALRAEVERLTEWNREITVNAREFVAENEKLRAALKKINVGDGWAALIARAALEGK